MSLKTILFPLVILFALNSCFTSLGGLVIYNESKNNKNIQEQNESAVGHYDGWRKPVARDINVRLLLSNGDSLIGAFQKEEYLIFDTDTTTLVVIKNTKGKKIKCPSERIDTTEISTTKTKSVWGYLVLGVAVDVLLLIYAVRNGGFSWNWN